MNHQYRIVWNDSTHTWMAVAETARSHGKSQGTRTSTSARTIDWVLRPLAMAMALWCGLVHAAPPVATQLPTGGQVMAGQATISQAGQAAVLNVNQSSASAVINWNTFNLGSAASVNFAQPDRNATVLNRVLDANPSQIYGRINAPGQVFFSNPNGMYFAPSASVDVGGLVATTHSISTDDFMAGNYRFTRDGATGAIVNEGQLQAGLGGYVALLAPEVRNQGVVMAQMGTVALAAGESYQLQIQGSRLSQIDVTPATIRTLVENGQAVLAPEGMIILSAKAAQQLEASVVNSGQLAANSLVERGGRIVLESTGSVTAGGSIQANSAQGQGGRVTITGEQISLPVLSDIQATGGSGGGTVLVGGDWQGSNGVPQATRVTMEDGARIDASATQNGDGGKVVLWSDVHKAESQTTVHGSIYARGGTQGGDGGKVETSGHQVDIVGATVNAGADLGAGGLWLLDPYDYTIGAAEATTIRTSLNAGTNFTVDTTNANGGGITGTAGTGVITVNSAITVSPGVTVPTLTLNAADSIVLNANITASSSSVNVSMTAVNGNISGAGNLSLRRGLATFNQATTGIYSGVLSGVGAGLTKYGAGTLILTGANNMGALTHIFEGTLQVGNNGTVGTLGTTTASVYVETGATLAFKRSDDLTVTKPLSGTGTISQLANSNLTLTHNFSLAGLQFTGDLVINAGQLTLSAPDDNKFTGSAIRINNGSALGLTSTGGHNSYWLGTNIIFDANGGGSIKLMNNATNLVVSDSLTFTTNGGAQNRFYSTVGTSWGLNTNLYTTGGVIFNTAAGTNTNTGDLTIEVPLVNGGVLTKNGAGSVLITQDPTSGLTTLPYSTVAVNAGTFKVGNGGTGGLLGSGTATVAAGATLEFNRSDNITVSNNITGAGALSQQGSGTLTLSNNPTYSGATHLNAGTLVWQNDAPSTSSSGFDGTGLLTIQPSAASFTSAFSTSGWSLGNTLGGLTLGKTGNTAGITVPNAISIAGPINLIGGDLAINAALTATGGNTISLSSSGTVTEGASGALAASNLLLSGGNVTLDNTSNAIGTLAATGVSGLTFVNGSALTLGSVGGTNGVSASGIVDMSTTSGDLTISQSVSTTNTSASALTLNAGRATAALTDTGGNLLVSGSGSVSVGAGGTAKLYSGSVNDSTGLTALVSSGSGRFRYGSDESTTNYSLVLGTGLNAIYRQQPTVTRAVNSQTVTYADTLTQTFSVTDSVNGDTYNQAFGSATTPTVTVGGGTSTAGQYIVGTHTMSATGGANTSQLGYAVNSSTTSGTLTVNAKTLTTSYGGVNKMYDSLLTSTVTSSDDRVTGDVLTVGRSASFADKNVGTGKVVNVSGATLSGTDASNYALVSTTGSTTADITAKPLRVYYTAADKMYDGGLTATVTPTYNYMAGDTLTISQTAAFADKNVGLDKPVYVSGITVGGADANNYALVWNSTIARAAISAKPLTVNYSGVNKTYDGGVSATVTRSDDRVVGDVLTLSESASFADKNVGTGKTVSVTGVTLGGTDASNYSLVSTTGNTTADITARTLTVTYSGVNKMYNGTLAATVTRSDDRVTGDVLTLSETASFTDKNVGTGKVVNVSGAILSGTDAGNYALASTTGNTTADITAKPLRVGYTAADKMYDGGLTATVTPTYNYVAGDTLTISQTAAFADKNVGLDKPVYVSGITVGGADANNYALVWNSTIARAAISAKPLTVTYSGVNKTYDGSLDATVTYTDNRLAGDVFTVNQNALFADKNVGAGKAVSVTGVTLGGTDAGNYSLVSTTGNTTADITAKVLTITGFQVADKTYDGNTNSTVIQWGQANTGVGNETLLLNHGMALFDSANAGARTVEATGYSLVDGANGGLASNYLLSSARASSAATISKAVLQVVANDDAKFVTTNDVAGYAGVRYSGFVNGETSAALASLPTVSRSNSNVHTAGIYTGVLVPSGGTSSNYSFAYTSGDYTVVPANQLLMRMTPVTTTYGTPASYAIASASYYDPIVQQVVSLTDTSVDAANRVTVNDGVGGRASFSVTPRNSSLSSGQLLRVGAYALGVSGTVTENSQNFSDTITLIGSHTVTPKALAVVSTEGVHKTYDGSTSMSGVSFALNAVGGGAGIASGDTIVVTGNGDYANRNVGTQKAYGVNNVSISGADASNYYIATDRSFSGTNGSITPKALTLTALPDNKVYDGSIGSSVMPASGVLAAGDSISDLRQVFDSSDIGLRTLSVSGYTLNDGNGGGNYVVTRVPTTGSILPQQIPPQPGLNRTPLVVASVSNEAANTSVAGTQVAAASEAAAATARKLVGPVVTCPTGFERDAAVRSENGTKAVVEGLVPKSGVVIDAGAEQDAACLRVVVMRDLVREQVGMARVYVPREALTSDTGFVLSVALPVTQAGLSHKASLRDGSALPDWLSLDAKTNRLMASKVPPGGLPLMMRVQAGTRVMDVDLIEASAP